MQHLASTADKLAAQSQAATEYVSEEAIEELVAGAVDPMLENLYDPKAFGTRYKDPDTYADIAYSMLIGGLMGGIGTGGQLLVNNVTGRASSGQKTGTGDAGGSLPQSASLTAPSSEGALKGSSLAQGGLQADITGAENLTSPGVETETAASGAETTAINDNPAQHTAVEQRVIEEYKASVDQDLVDFVENARENKGGNSGRYEFKPVSDRAAADIKRLTGVDTTGFKTVMEQRAAEHILKRHGLSGKANQTMNDVNDIGRMQYVIDNYDSMEPGGKATSYTTIKKNGKPGTADTVKYVKAVDGTYYVCEAVPNTKAKTTFIVSAYLENRNADTTHPVLAENSPTSTAETADAYMSANMTIPQSAQNSKPKNLENRGIIDGTMVPGYNRIIEMEGAVTDGRTQTGAQLDRASGEGVPEGPGVLGSGGVLADTGTDGRAHLQGSGELRLNKTQDKKLYSRMLTEAREQDTENGWAVTPKTAEMLADCKTYLSDDGGVGYAIAPDEDIVAVFRNKQRHHQKGVLKEILPEAIANGGRKLDCYGKDLALLYAKFGGFTPVARAAFNPEYANPGWTPDNGTPDIYVMMATDTDPGTVRQKQGSYKLWSDAELDALPLMEYDDAMAYRDRLLAEQRRISTYSNGSFAGDGLGTTSAGFNKDAGPQAPTLEAYVRQMYEDARSWAKDSATEKLRERMHMVYGEEAATEGKPGLLRDSYVENALDSGTAERLDQVAKALGLNVRFVDRVAGGIANSSIKGNQVLIEKGNPNPVNFLLGHEITHRMQELAPAQYQRFKELVANEADTRLDARETLENYRQKGLDLTDEGAMDEAVVDYAGRMLEDGQLLDNFIRRYSGERTLLEKLRDAFRALIEKLHGGERRQAQLAVDRLNRALDTAAKKVSRGEGTTTGTGTERYSLAEYIRFGEKLPTYEELIKKPDVNIVDIRGERTGRISEQRKNFLNSERAKQIYARPVVNKDTGEAMFITPNTLTHTFFNLGAEQIALAEHLQEVIQEAVLTHGETSRKAPQDRTTGVYTLFGAVRTAKGVQPVKLKVKEYYIEGQDVPQAVKNYLEAEPQSQTYASVYDGKVLVLESIEKEEASSSAITDAAQSAAVNYPSASSKISVKDLLALVKGDAKKYVPVLYEQSRNNGSESILPLSDRAAGDDKSYALAEYLHQQQADAQRELALTKSKLQSQYEAALTQARASGNADLANALYKELVRIQKLKREDDRVR